MDKTNRQKIFLDLTILLLFGTLTAIIYANTLGVPFYFDDIPRIQDNPFIRISEINLNSLKNAAINYFSPLRYISNLSFAFNYYFHQYRMQGYHVVNISIHIFTGFLLFLFTRTMLTIDSNNKSERHLAYPTPNYSVISFFAALIWLLHPLHTNSVTYIIQRQNSMASLFFLLALLLYIKGRLIPKKYPEKGSIRVRRQYVYYLLAFFSWVVSLLCKEHTFILPFVILTFGLLFFEIKGMEWLKQNAKYCVGAAIALLIIGLIITGFEPIENFKSLSSFKNKEFTFFERVLTQPRVIIYYISLLFYPNASRLNFDYDYPLSHTLTSPLITFLSLSAIAILIIFAFYIASRNRILSFIILWYFICLIMESSIIPLAVIFEHRTYLPSMLMPLLVIYSLIHIRPQKLPLFLICAVIAILSIWTYERNNLWKDKISFWQDCIDKSPNKARPYVNLGKTLLNENKIDAALRIFTHTLKIDQNNADIHLNIGVAFEKSENIQNAMHHYHKSLMLNPGLTEAHNNIGTLYKEAGNIKKAIMHYNNAISLNPYFPQAYYNLGILFEQQGEFEEAIRAFQQAAQLSPDSAIAHNNLGTILLKTGKPSEAKLHFLQAIHIRPNYPNAHYNLGMILEKQSKTDDAITHYRIATQAAPDYFKASIALANALFSQGSVEEASEHFEKLYQTRDNLSKNDTKVKVLFTIGLLYKNRGELSKAIEQFKKALDYDASNIQVLKQIADIYSMQNENDTAILYYKKIIAANPEVINAYYNIACLYARQNSVEGAIEWLKKAMERGYDNIKNIKIDTDLEAIRHTQYFQEIIK